ncbi:uncharacterized protein [Apostichopus japonicus]|uniref:uncharacterized protein isoform X2 n=1 Tax=Stichopus japonicus TaxID=307972 RepID=UPI003AB2EE9E
MEIGLTVILLILYGFISTEGTPTHQTVENKDASICYSHHKTSDRSSIFRKTSCNGDHDLEVPPDSSIVTSLLNFIPDRHYQDVNERTVGTPCDGATENRWLNMTQENSTTKEKVNTADADVTHITTLAQHDTTKSTERPDSTTKQSVKTADADMARITTLAQHDTTKSTERPVTTKEGVKNQSMYWISDDEVTWSKAVDRCRNLYNNGHLVHIDNEEENKEVAAFREQTLGGDTWIWIGIHDSEKEGVWTYEDGSSLTYVNWGNGEPNGGLRHGDEDCVLMRKGGDYNDVKCEVWKLHFCCEYYVVI